MSLLFTLSQYASGPGPVEAVRGSLTSPPSCAADSGSWCQRVYDATGMGWLAQFAGVVVGPAISIAVILAVAIVVHWLVRRLIAKLAAGAAAGRVPAVLRPLKDKAAHRLYATTLANRRAQRARTLASLLRSVASFVIYGIAFVLILSKLGINIAPIIASAGVVGVAVGFGAQNLVGDFLSGIFMMVEDQYGVGDWVDLGKAAGTVEAVGLRISTVRDVDGSVWYVRNGQITAVGNYNQRFAVAVVDVPVAYDADVERAIEVVGDAAQAAVTREPLSADVLGDVDVLGAQTITNEAVTLRLLVTTKPGRQWAVRRALNLEVKAALDAADVPSPFAALVPAGRGEP